MIRKILGYWNKPFAFIRALWFNVIGMWWYRLFELPRIVRRVSKKERINVVFFALNVSMWRYDGVYKRMMEDARFNPRILVTPRLNEPFADRVVDQKATISFFKSKGYLVDGALNDQTGEWIDLNVLEPDIIFYTQPYSGHIVAKYEFFTVRNALLCYAPYAYQLFEKRWNYDTPCQNYCWFVFLASQYEKEVALRYSRIKARNVVPAGYGFFDEYLDASKDADAIEQAWRRDPRKRVIWAPHHSIDPNHALKVSSFLDISGLMLQLKDKYSDRIIFAFKPHPMLYSTLCRFWGEAQAKAYYKKWEDSENSFYVDGDYLALFAGSDAMVHCSGSFIAEYLYTGKPVQYVYSKTSSSVTYGEICKKLLSVHYEAHNGKDIIDFLENVVLAGIDPKKTMRSSVKREYLTPPNGKTFAENVCNAIMSGIGKQ